MQIGVIMCDSLGLGTEFFEPTSDQALMSGHGIARLKRNHGSPKGDIFFGQFMIEAGKVLKSRRCNCYGSVSNG